MTMDRAKPRDVAGGLDEEMGLMVIAARDGKPLSVSFCWDPLTAALSTEKLEDGRSSEQLFAEVTW
jgi:hypothetical protein